MSEAASCIAGIAVTPPLAGVSSCPSACGTLRRTVARLSALSPGSIDLGPAGVRGHLSADGRTITTFQELGEVEDVRRVVPFAAALQGVVMLHASAIRTPVGVHAFVGASGAGKSTLARRFQVRGSHVVADDLLPLRENSGSVELAHECHLPGVGERLAHRVATVSFIRRSALIVAPHLVRISRARALNLLLRHGFGEIASRTIWERQFAIYSRLVDSSRAGVLWIPEGLDQLDGHLTAVERLLSREPV